ncbi:hypothetical protein K469DRAFT_746751 [Zopfia rhizophila CBS 207.26]|uniref:F-box domain-containing protein n=1 Tax=Zopfia rhizophila CBS 207.26 TaxID=1314779 RepID=A0A6A6EI99_9PEZI|nr:hypothetical protein K469DRAFT_746751 [Zopfia rhizophila CBS 207.26]
MAAAEVVQGFRNLQSNSGRREALDGIMNELNPYEWRRIKEQLDGREFFFDIIGKVPLEIVVQIFSYLDVLVPFRLQCVSQQWKTVLRSPDVLKRVLRNWYTDNDPPLGGEEALQGNEHAIFQLRAQHLHRLRTGRGHQYMHVSMSIAKHGSLLNEDTITWISNPSQRALNVFNLRTGKYWQGYGEAREKVEHVTLSEQLVAFTTFRNVCYVRDLSTGDRKSFKLLPGTLDCIICRGRMIACGGIIKDQATIYIWDFDTQKGQTFDIPLTEKPFRDRESNSREVWPFALLPNPESRSVMVFSSDYSELLTPGSQQRYAGEINLQNDRVESTIFFSRFSFSGQKISDGFFRVPNIASIWPLGFRPVNRDGCFALEVDCRNPNKVWGGRYGFQFDERVDQFTDPFCPTSVYGPWVETGISWWKNIHYRVYYCRDKGLQLERMVLDEELNNTKTVCLGTREAPTSETLLDGEFISREYRFEKLIQSSPVRLFVNDNFIVVFHAAENLREAIEVWSFDKNLELPKGHLSRLSPATVP